MSTLSCFRITPDPTCSIRRTQLRTAMEMIQKQSSAARSKAPDREPTSLQ